MESCAQLWASQCKIIDIPESDWWRAIRKARAGGNEKIRRMRLVQPGDSFGGFTSGISYLMGGC